VTAARLRAASAVGEAAPLLLPQVIGHRGAALSAPENTLGGFRIAKALGVEWVEFDVHLSGDGRAIVLHDDTIDRTTNGSGTASRMSFAALRAFDAGAWFSPTFAGERIPDFAEAVALLGELGLAANVEIKPARGQEAATAHAAVEVIHRCWPKHLPPPLISSFAPESLAVALAEAPELRRGHLFARLPKDWRQRAEALQCTTIHCSEKRLSHQEIVAVREAGYPLLAYTVNVPARAKRLIEWGVSAVFSDCPDRILAALEGG
jgi:glycerophosphoryl diester phosphodiesterase